MREQFYHERPLILPMKAFYIKYNIHQDKDHSIRSACSN